MKNIGKSSRHLRLTAMLMAVSVLATVLLTSCQTPADTNTGTTPAATTAEVGSTAVADTDTGTDTTEDTGTTEQTAEVITQGEAVKLILNAADFYNPKLKEADVTKDFGDVKYSENDPVTTAEFAVLVSRAFGKLPTPVGDNLRVSPEPISVESFPEWGKTDAENIANARIWIGGKGDNTDTDFNAQVTAEQANLIISELYALYGTNLKDDFYHAVNKEVLDKSVIKPGYPIAGHDADMGELIDEHLNGIIKEYVDGTYDKGTKEQKIADFYKSAADMSARDKVGYKPIKPYLDEIDTVKDLDGLWAVDKKIQKRLSYSSLLLPVALGLNLSDSTQYQLNIKGYQPSQPKEVYASADVTPYEAAYKEYTTQLLKLTGDKDAENKADILYNFEKTLAAVQLEPQEYNDPSKTHNLYTLDELQKLFPSVDINDVIAISGYKPEQKLNVMDKEMFETYAGMFKEENLSDLKVVMKLYLLRSSVDSLDSNFIDVVTKYRTATSGSDATQTAEKAASDETKSTFSDYLGKAYTDRYFSAEAKADVTNMINMYIDVYKKRIEQLDWMSDITKEKAIKKLNAVNIKVGYPDVWRDSYKDTKIKADDYFGNLVSTRKAQLADSASEQGKSVDKTLWLMTAFELNAYYAPSFNEIVFPAGYLQAPLYDINASVEENLGAVGTIIAHEITHAFDNTGAQYDEKGNVSNWWTEEDAAKFGELCQAVVAQYDGVELAPGITSNGALTLGENIGDLGAISATLDLAEKIEKEHIGGLEKFDYKKFFEGFAKKNEMSLPRNFVEMLNSSDVHSITVARTNQAVQNFDKFYEVYGIKEGDGMYLAPEKRVHIW